MLPHPHRRKNPCPETGEPPRLGHARPAEVGNSCWRYVGCSKVFGEGVEGERMGCGVGFGVIAV